MFSIAKPVERWDIILEELILWEEVLPLTLKKVLEPEGFEALNRPN